MVRERDGDTNTFVGKSKAVGIAAVRACVDADAVIHADEASHWSVLQGSHVARRINHGVCHADGTACTNQAESLSQNCISEDGVAQGRSRTLRTQRCVPIRAETALSLDLSIGPTSIRPMSFAQIGPSAKPTSWSMRSAMTSPKHLEAPTISTFIKSLGDGGRSEWQPHSNSRNPGRADLIPSTVASYLPFQKINSASAFCHFSAACR